jgi:hypothetical protein
LLAAATGAVHRIGGDTAAAPFQPRKQFLATTDAVISAPAADK